MVLSVSVVSPCGLVAGWELWLTATAQHRERWWDGILLAGKRSKFKIQRVVSTEWVSFSHVEKSLSQTIGGQGAREKFQLYIYLLKWPIWVVFLEQRAFWRYIQAVISLQTKLFWSGNTFLSAPLSPHTDFLHSYYVFRILGSYFKGPVLSAREQVSSKWPQNGISLL